MADLVLEFLPVIIVAAIIGAFTIAFLIAYAALRKHKDESEDQDRRMSDREIVTRLLRYAKPYRKSFIGVFFIMLFSIIYELLSPALIGDIQSLIKNNSFRLEDLYVRVGVYASILAVSLICTYLQAMLLQKKRPRQCGGYSFPGFHSPCLPR